MGAEQAKYFGKHVFLDVFMESCYYCREFQGQFNAIYDEMNRLYGPDQVIFLQINKDELPDIKSKYHVSRYPSFYYIKPFENARDGVRFEDERNYENVLEWMRMKVRTNGGLMVVDEAEVEEEEEVVFTEEPDEDDFETEIVSITDVVSGENLHFEIDGEEHEHDHEHEHEEP